MAVVLVIALGSVSVVGCLEPEEPQPPAPIPCIHAGISYLPGASFLAPDGCNTCVCTEDGSVACSDEPCTKTGASFRVEKDGESIPYDSVTTEWLVASSTIRLIVKGYRAMSPSTSKDDTVDVLTLVFDRTALEALQSHTSYTLNGKSTWNTGNQNVLYPEWVAFTPEPSHTSAVTKVYFDRYCTCPLTQAGSQTWSGSIVFDQIPHVTIQGKTGIGAAITLTMTGNVPHIGAQWGADQESPTFDLTITVGLSDTLPWMLDF
ncbi:MAG: hypothetical protein KC609_12255 [Myxococcales bacterium]|nr:hypothetical protein [Myxococcales bacterium]